LNLGEALRKLFRDIKGANQRINQFETEAIPKLDAEIVVNKNIISE
jgi:vacuolar-type H+-ATPase subunit D/Vma8